MMLTLSRYVGDKQTETLLTNSRSVASVVSNMQKKDMLSPDDTANITMLSNSLSMISATIEADVFVCAADGSVLYCREGVLSADGTQRCSRHAGIQIPADVLAQVNRIGEYRERTKFGEQLRKKELAVVVPVMTGESPSPSGYVCALQDTGALLRPYMKDYVEIFLFSSVIALLLAFAGVYVLTYTIVTPLREMSKATKSYAKGDFTYRVRVRGNDELSELAEEFNAMARDLGVLEASRRSFVANVSHELKTPMTTIGGFIDGILDSTIPPEEQAYYLHIVSDEVKRLSRLVVSMLNMSKIESGELQLKPTRYDISHQMFQIMLNFEKAIEKKGIEIQGLDRMDSVFVEADEDLIHQVIYNLIDNAVKFTPERGCITVSTMTDNKKVIVRVRNSGAGIEPEELGRIFERFYKVDKSRSVDVKGAGLGLYIVRSIIELHGGQIAAKSELGSYTEFVFWMPATYGAVL